MASSWGFGYWNQLTMNARQPACTGLAFMAIGNILYTFLENIPVGRKWFMLVARLLVGFGSGPLALHICIFSLCARNKHWKVLMCVCVLLKDFENVTGS
ncbi:unnamed protein product [Anisakis simplex]|uniref:MFS domain-containing protein n=1 Tax=Anisakis simplex TaxID=6269 RepID=A0A0M3JK85_ANISI|nr:unnamed protein product [Anisakis simplex]